MYSFALVIWEVLRRTKLEQEDENEEERTEYALPYFQDVTPGEFASSITRQVCTSG